jgi:uncharacterized protein (TIGR00299 family) protein
MKTKDGTKKIIYLDAASGISGDMFLGALSDICLALDRSFSLEALIGKIGLDGASLSVTPDNRGGISGLKVDVHSHEHHPRRHLSDILGMLNAGNLPPLALTKASEAFTLLAEAEAGVHGTTADEVHFHEVGAVDSIIDITGAMLLMDWLGWPEVISSPVNVGSGIVKSAHGVLPVPAPATAELLRGMKIFSSGEPMERTTPTGALLVRLLVGEDGFRGLPAGRMICAGTGLGSKDTADMPNVLRAILLEPDAERTSGRFGRDETSLIEANIDDMTPQDFSHVTEKLLSMGALDVWRENILMKKSRLAVKLCCLCQNGDTERLGEAMLLETTTLGVRVTQARRLFLERSIEDVATSLGRLRVKSASLDGRTVKKTPEYDDLLRISTEKNMPLPVVRRIIEREIYE